MNGSGERTLAQPTPLSPDWQRLSEPNLDGREGGVKPPSRRTELRRDRVRAPVGRIRTGGVRDLRQARTV